MIKALLVDGDGIVLKPRDKYFSDRLREDGYDFPKEKETEFFKEAYPDIRLGRKDLREEVGKRISEWNWDKSADDLLEYWFSYENQLEQEVVDIIQQIRRKGVNVYLVSDHSAYRANELWESVGLKEYFDGQFFSCYLGTTKDQPDFYEKVLHELQLKPDEVVFFDDEEENVEAASDSGINAKLYSGTLQLKDLLS